MRALILHGPGDLRLERVSEPRPGPGEVLLRIEVAATCATDAKILRNGAHPALDPLPAAFGHEAVGTVAAVGDGVDTVRPGERVVPANSAPCGRCDACARPGPGQCENLRFLWGAYAELLLIPEEIVRRNLVVLPPDIPAPLATLAEPLACAVRAVRLAGPEEGSRAVILGGGAQGAMLAALSSARGCEVAVCDPHAERRERALRFGARDVHDRVEPTGVEEARRRLGEPDLVIEAVGRPEAWRAAVGLVRSGGQVLAYGGCAPGTVVDLPAARFHYDEITLRGSFHHDPEAFREAVEMLRDRMAPFELLLGEPIGLEDVPQALREGGAKRPVFM